MHLLLVMGLRQSISRMLTWRQHFWASLLSDHLAQRTIRGAQNAGHKITASKPQNPKNNSRLKKLPKSIVEAQQNIWHCVIENLE